MLRLSNALMIPILKESSAQLINSSPIILEQCSAYPITALLEYLNHPQPSRCSPGSNIQGGLRPADQLVPWSIRTVLSLSDNWITLILELFLAFAMLSWFQYWMRAPPS
jgi:hypothetical protein